MLHAIIMAGGSGTRFWPESRSAMPKQLLRLAGDRSMLQATVDRLAQLVPKERVAIITNVALSQAIHDQLPELPKSSIVGEPCKRDTAPCIGLAAMLVSRDDPNATMVVMPADHVIRPEEKFCTAIEHAVALVDESPGRIVTFGIRPTYPAESFGYVERGAPLTNLSPDSPPTFEVSQFREKPDATMAAEYVESGQFYWNSGIFVWKARTILDALREHQGEMYAHLENIADSLGTENYESVLEREFTAIKGVSIDYAVMEHAQDVLVVEAPFQWDDVGSWQAMARLHGSDEEGNTIDAAKYLGINTHKCVVRSSEDHLIVTVGLENCLVVHTPHATLVANRDDEEAVREVVSRLKELGWDEYL